MHPRTTATLDRLRSADWFRNVGVQDTDAARILTSWEQAIESCSSLDWENLCQEAVNQYRERIRERDTGRYNSWNEIVSAVRPNSVSLVQEKTRRVVEAHSLPKVFVDVVNWDMLHICMEAEFADVFPPGFYGSQAYWYAVGHFPCGWEGTFPGGRLIIF